jgi:hypothetical protein
MLCNMILFNKIKNLKIDASIYSTLDDSSTKDLTYIVNIVYSVNVTYNLGVKK